MTYGYLRVSSSAQNSEYQKNMLLHYCNNHKLGNVDFIEDVISGSKSWKDRRINEIVKNSKKGDKVLVNEFSRLGRSLLDVLEIIRLLKEKDVEVHIVRENMILGDDISSKIMITMLSLVSEIERDLIKSRVKEGLENAKKNGVQLGRRKGIYKSKLDEKRSIIEELLSKGVSKSSIAKIIDVKYQTLVSYCNKRDI
jgi:DNA invertase Pin-like site-specific DNA recombinase